MQAKSTRDFNPSLLANEYIVFRTKKHIIIFFYPLVWTLFMLYVTVIKAQYFTYILRLYATFSLHAYTVLTVITLMFWGLVYLEYYFSDFIVTDKRVIMREGFFNRHMTEMRLNTVSQVDIDQSLCGQLLNYGILTIRAFGAQDTFTTLARPRDFQHYVNAQLDKRQT